MEIFAGNLPFELTQKELVDFFSQCGEVGKVRMLFDAQGRFRGIAYVEFLEDACARKAIAELNGKELKSRAVKVDFARPMRPRFNGFGGAFGRGDRPARRRFENGNGAADAGAQADVPRGDSSAEKFKTDKTDERKPFKKPFGKSFGKAKRFGGGFKRGGFGAKAGFGGHRGGRSESDGDGAGFARRKPYFRPRRNGDFDADGGSRDSQ